MASNLLRIFSAADRDLIRRAYEGHLRMTDLRDRLATSFLSIYREAHRMGLPPKKPYKKGAST